MSKPVCNDVISFDTKVWSGWLFKSRAKEFAVVEVYKFCVDYLQWD